MPREDAQIVAVEVAAAAVTVRVERLGERLPAGEEWELMTADDIRATWRAC